MAHPAPGPGQSTSGYTSCLAEHLVLVKDGLALHLHLQLPALLDTLHALQELVDKGSPRGRP